MAQIIVSANIVIPSGPAFAINQTLDVEAYDKIDVTVKASASDKQVELQPGGSGRLKFIAIMSDAPGVSYKIDKTTNYARQLDQPHLLFGDGAVSLFGDSPPPATPPTAPPPLSLFFTNAATTGDAKVQILTGRDATP